MRFIADGHQDIASSVIESGRDFSRSEPKYSLSLDGLGKAGVGFVLATVFAAGEGGDGFDGVPAADQLAFYEEMERKHGDRIALARTRDQLLDAPGSGVTRFGILLEGADPMPDPSSLDKWRGQGLLAASLTWNNANRYAGGVASDQGLTGAGKEFLAEMSRLSIVLDVSHLNDRSFDDVMQEWEGPVCASHSNARALAPSRRNLTDAQISAIASRGGLIGLNFYQGFLTTQAEKGPRPTIADVVRHALYVAEIGGPGCLALGTDFDGGFGPEMSPLGCERLEELPGLAYALDDAGFPPDGIDGVMGMNWLRLLSPALPPAKRE